MNGLDVFCDASVVNLFGHVMGNNIVGLGAYGYYIPSLNRYKVDVIRNVNASLVNFCELKAFYKTLVECAKLCTKGVLRVHTDANCVYVNVNKMIQLKVLFGCVPDSFFDGISCKKSAKLYKKIAQFDFENIFVLKVKAHQNKFHPKYIANNCIDQKVVSVARQHKENFKQ